MYDFIERVRFDRVGVFAYSAEDSTPAALLSDKVHARTAQSRFRKIMELQQGISLEKNRALIGSRMEVLVESNEGEVPTGRSYRDAPDIDGLVYITEGGSATPGDFVQVEITDAEHYDLTGKL